MNVLRSWAIAALIGAGICFATIHAWAQGSLTPPGAPAATMKTLQQVEPRIPITNVPVVITSPGSYYFTGNLSFSGPVAKGVQVLANDVTLDLMGFSLASDNGFAVFGVEIRGATNVCVRNGSIDGCEAVTLTAARNCRIENLRLATGSSSATSGVDIGDRCFGNTVTDCAIDGSHNLGYGYGIAIFGTSSWNRVVNCIVNCGSSTTFTGVFLSGPNVSGNQVADCIVGGAGACGILVTNAVGNAIECNYVSGGFAFGIRSAGTAAKNVIVRNTCIGNSTNFSLLVTDSYGPIVSSSGPMSTSDNSVHPWANFSR